MRSSRFVVPFISFAVVAAACGGAQDEGAVFDETSAESATTVAIADTGSFDADAFWAEVDEMYATEIELSVDVEPASDTEALRAQAGLVLLTDAYVNAVMRTSMLEVTGADSLDDAEWGGLVDEAIASWDRFSTIRDDVDPVLALPTGVSGIRSLWAAQLSQPGGQCRLLQPGQGIENEIAVLSATQRAEQIGASRRCIEEVVAENIRATEGTTDAEAIAIIKAQYGLTDVESARAILQERRARKDAQGIIKKVGETALAVGISGLTGGIGPITYIMVGDVVVSIAFSTVDHPGRQVIDKIGAVDKVVSWKETVIEGTVHTVIDLAATGTRLDGEAAMEVMVDEGRGTVRIRPAPPPLPPDPYIITTGGGTNVDLVGACPARSVNQWRQTPCPGDDLIGATERRLAASYPLEGFLDRLLGVTAFSGVYAGAMPVVVVGYGEVGTIPVTVTIEEDGTFVGVADGTVITTIEGFETVYSQTSTCAGTVTEDGSMECTGSSSASVTINGVGTAQDNVVSAIGHVGDGQIVGFAFTGADGITSIVDLTLQE